jgi:cysteine desulfurase
MKTPAVIYLDNHATTPIDQRVLEHILPWMTSDFGNAHSRDHIMGEKSFNAVEVAREDVATLVGAEPNEVIFTSGATESINLAIIGFCLRRQKIGSRIRIALPPTEHNAVIETCREMEHRGLASLRWIKVDYLGRIDVEDVETACREKVELLCVMGANNEIGNIYPIEIIGSIAAQYGTVFFCDGSQSVGKVPIDVGKCQISFLAVSAHKLYGPKGVGALVIRQLDLLSPIQFGGAQERGLRPGTLNVPGIVGLGFACHLRKAEMVTDEASIRDKRDRLQEILSQQIPNLQITGDLNNKLAGNLHVAVADVPNDAVIARVRNRLAISTGSACSSGAESPSHVLRAIEMKEDYIHGALRMCVGKFTTEQDIDEAADILCNAVRQIRGVSQQNCL